MRYQNVTAHKLIADLCVHMAEEIYEEVCSGSNAVYKVQGNRRDFVKQCAPTMKPAAIGVLGSMLRDPKLSEWDKEQIYEALVMDRSMPKDGTSVVKRYDH